MSNKTNFLGIEIPYVHYGMVGGSNLHEFPNHASEDAKLLAFIKEMSRASRDDIYDKFSSARYFGFFKGFDLIKWNMDDDTYSLTKAGEDMITLITWLAPVYDLAVFMEKAEFSSAEELDILLAMSGRHDLAEDDVLKRVRIIFCYGENTFGLEAHYWVKVALRAICRSLMTCKEELEALFKKIDTEVAA